MPMLLDDPDFNPFAPRPPAPVNSFFVPPEGRTKPPPPPSADRPGEAEGRALTNEERRLSILEKEGKLASGGEHKIEQDAAAGYAERMINADALYGAGVDPRSPALQTMYDITPQNFAYAYQSPELKAAKDYVEDFIRAQLRMESGAAIPEKELKDQYPRYFAMPNDTPADLERKKMLRKQAIHGMMIKAGPRAADLAVVGGQGLGGTSVLPVPAGSPLLSEPSFVDVAPKKLNLTGLGSEPRPGGPIDPHPFDVAAKTREDNPVDIIPGERVGTQWPIGATFRLVGGGLWQRTKEDEITNLETGDKAPYREEAYDISGAERVEEPPTPDVPNKIPGPMNPLTGGFLDDIGKNQTVQDLLKGTGSVVEGAGNIPGLVVNPFVAGANYLAGKELARPDFGANLREGLGLPGNDSLMGTAIEAATGAFLPAATATKVSQVVTNPSALAAFTTLAKEPVRQAVAGVTGALSGEAAREAGAPWPLQLAANVVGSVAGYGGTKVVAPTRVADPALAAASREANVPISQPMIKGNQAAINKAAVREADPLTATMIQDPLNETSAAIERGLKRDVRGNVAAPDEVEVGRSVRQMAKDITGPDGLDKRAADKLYKNAEDFAGDPLVDQVEMRGKIDAKIAELAKNPKTNAAEIKALKDYRKDVATAKPLSYLRQLRTTINDNISGTDLNRSAAQRRADAHMAEILKGTNKDIENALNPDALKLWKKADAVYSKQMDFKDVLQRFIGKNVDELTDEQIFANVKRAVEKDHAALDELYRRLPPGKRQEVAAFFAETLGKRGQDEPFSPDRLISQALKIGDRQRVRLFGEQGARALDNLLFLSRRLKLARSEINRSKTSRPVIDAIRSKANTILTTLMTAAGAGTGVAAGGGGGGAVAGSVVGAAAAGTVGATKGAWNALSARKLMDPKLTLVLADAASARDPASYRDIAIRLGTIIARDPSLQETLGPLQQVFEEGGGKRNKRDLTVEATR